MPKASNYVIQRQIEREAMTYAYTMRGMEMAMEIMKDAVARALTSDWAKDHGRCFSPEMIRGLHEHMMQDYADHKRAWQKVDDAEQYQEWWDAPLRRAYGDDYKPFLQRHKYTGEYDYDTGKWRKFK